MYQRISEFLHILGYQSGSQLYNSGDVTVLVAIALSSTTYIYIYMHLVFPAFLPVQFALAGKLLNSVQPCREPFGTEVFL